MRVSDSGLVRRLEDNTHDTAFTKTLGGILDGLPEPDTASGLELMLDPQQVADIAPPTTVTESQEITGASIAPLGRFAGTPPEAPPGVSINDNIRRGEGAIPHPGLATRAEAYGMMLDLFPSGHEMDYKKDDKKYRDFGNFNYGAFGSALGLTPYELHTGAGVQQLRDGTWSWKYGLPGVSGTMGDNSTDYGMIDEGIQYYRTHKDP
jgi:hypothetical protein